MMGHLMPDIPRIYTAAAEWMACMLFIVSLKKRFEWWKSGLIMAGMLVMQSVFLVATGNVPIYFWIPCMIAAVSLMVGFIYFCCDVNFQDAGYFGMIAFVVAEFMASLEWQIVCSIWTRQLPGAGMQVLMLAAGLKSWEPLLKSSMAFVTAEYLSTDEGKGFGEKYRNGEVTMDGTWNPYIETWSQLIDNGVYTADMTGIDHDQALEQFATGGSAMFCSGPWDYDAIMEKNPELQLDMMPFYGTKESAGWLIGGPGCGFAANASSKNLDAVKKVLAAISTTDGQNALWQNNQGGSSYLNGVEFDLPEAYTSVAGALAAGNVYCPWNEWGSAAGAHETYGTEMQSYLLGAQDLSTTLQTVDEVVSELLSK